MTLVKICGLRSESLVVAAIEAGADRVGFVLVHTSPRFVDFDTATTLARLAHRLGREAWVVAAWSETDGPTVAGLDRFVRETPEVSAVQLHGRETPADVTAFRALVPGRRVVKAIGVATRADLALVESYPQVDGFLLDARPPAGADRGGGFGRAFDWTILAGFAPGKPWLLSGGLAPENVAEAIRVSGAREVDVSSGVESSPGVKDPAKVKAFIEAAKAAG